MGKKLDQMKKYYLKLMGKQKFARWSYILGGLLGVFLIWYLFAGNTYSELEVGKEYTYYADGSCTERKGRKCVTQEFINKLCKVKKVGVSRLLATGYSKNRDFRELAQANGVSAEVFIDNNKCGLIMTTQGIYRGTSKRITYTCNQVNTFIKLKDERLMVSWASSCWTL